MQHIRIATYEIQKGTFGELAELAQDGMLSEFRSRPGFIRYGLADIGDRRFLSVSLWETREDADASIDVSADWVRDHVSELVRLTSTQVGDLAFYEGTATKGVPAKV